MTERSSFFKENNTIIVLTVFVMIQFQVSVFCNFHGFSPQSDVDRYDSDERTWISLNRRHRRDGGESFYRSITAGYKYLKNNEQFSKSGDILTREIRVKQGKLKGLVKEFKNKKLKNVETFLGIPYAAPPVKSFRFMPPGSPPTWKDVKIFDSFKPVCPQKVPDLTHEPLKTMNAGYYNRLKGLMPFLTNQSEDCLYLNVYAPAQDGKHQKKYPVIVYIHGESFEWNSGNPYDGSVLASYGNVVVVTINFRLGILGFLKPGLSEHTVSNFGLLDQIAALQWVKDNIEEFGGDSSRVTLMGHGTGAACINFLMVSPVSMASEGLFHKAILMSGTALSDWAITQNPLQFTIQVAEALNCPLIEKNDELSNCLRKKRLSEIMSVKVDIPEFQTPFGPVIDGSVVPNTPQQVMGVYQNLFTRYDLLYGITEWEVYHILDPVSLTYGMLEGERNEFLRKFMHSRYETLPYFALATTLSEYLDWRKPIPPIKSAAEEHRDLLLDLLSDARYSAPVVQMAQYHSKINPKSYLYIFQHKSKLGEFAGSERSVSGEEISYAFGSPLLNEEGPLSHHKFSLTEQLLSESMVTYFTNFAKTGNPNAPRRSEYIILGPKEWQEFDVYWPEYDNKNQSYLALGIPPFVGHHYRSQMTQLWNQILPDLLSNPTKSKQQKPDIPFFQKPTTSSPYLFSKKASDDSYDEAWSYGTVRMSPNEYQKDRRPIKNTEEDESLLLKQINLDEKVNANEENDDNQSTWMSSLIGVSVFLLLINAIIIITIYYTKRKRTNVKNESRRKSWKNSRENNSENEFGVKADVAESFYTAVECSASTRKKPKSNNSKEDEKIPQSLKKVFVSTSENSTKVKKWIQSEILKKYSKEKKNDRKRHTEMNTFPKKMSAMSEESISSLNIKPILKSTNTLSKKSVEKVSIGIDATPSTRGDSVLKQTPIELTKSLDRGILDIQPSLSEHTIDEAAKPVVKSQTSISLQILPTNDNLQLLNTFESEIIKLEPKSNAAKNSFQTFLPARRNSKDINVTSRDSDIVLISPDEYVDPLKNIQKRNFPKVLPDFPSFKAKKPLSFPQSSSLNNEESNGNKLQLEHTPPPPPPPPPRVSTLQRKDKQNLENQANEFKLLTFSTMNSKIQEKKTTNQPVKINEGETDGEKYENCASSATSNKSDSTKKKSIAPKEHAEKEKIQGNKTEKIREKPNIVIRSKVGPSKKTETRQSGGNTKKAHVNLQLNEKDKPKNFPQLDSKGPSDKGPEINKK